MSALPPKADILASPRASIYLHWLSGQIALFEFGRKHVLIGHANCAAKRASGHAPIRAMSAQPNARSLDLCQRTTQRLRWGCHRYPTPQTTGTGATTAGATTTGAGATTTARLGQQGPKGHGESRHHIRPQHWRRGWRRVKAKVSPTRSIIL